MKKQTAIQLLKETLDSEIKLGTKMVVNWDMYLQMERQQHGKTWDAALKRYDERGGNYARAWEDFEDYYNETLEQMITPKEKAEQLIDKFIKTNGNSFFAKECVLIVLDEIILEQCKSSELKDPRYQDERLIYWQEVKKIIKEDI